MTDILDKIDEALLTAMPNDGIQFNGLCQIVEKSGQPSPVTIEDNIQVSLSDKWDAVTYYRLQSASFQENDNKQFGRKIGNQMNQGVRFVVGVKSSKGENWIIDFCNNIPEEISTLTDYEYIYISGLNLITDQKAIYEDEFGANSYEKHVINWNLYAISFTVEFIRC